MVFLFMVLWPSVIRYSVYILVSAQFKCMCIVFGCSIQPYAWGALGPVREIERERKREKEEMSHTWKFSTSWSNNILNSFEFLVSKRIILVVTREKGHDNIDLFRINSVTSHGIYMPSGLLEYGFSEGPLYPL